MPSALTILRNDHLKVKGLLRKLDKTTERSEKMRKSLRDQILMELKIHSKVEEEVFYPAYLAAATKSEQREVFFEATEEHHVVDLILPELMVTSPSSEQFGAKAKLLKEMVEHHIEEEEGAMFTNARRFFTQAELQGLGETMQARRSTLLAQWKNPVLRPLKKLQSMAERAVPASVKNMKAKVIGAVMNRDEAR